MQFCNYGNTVDEKDRYRVSGSSDVYLVFVLDTERCVC